ncbi:hypothetical protein SLEP1_g25129 [Rubroshorea leprosula]|uniref:Uncharacterized protein n=1 Tax=Rubroshorea leprosula TaxID=152421 RepID=A0AAV5JSE8_9ROSI|nr:hypothetical protein SLEP1_g25129 [Rubroshorea leprosula]
MDVYSNVLYTKECFSALSYLAHRVILTDKCGPETCCIIGNYYSLNGQHEKSVMYFKRALKLNKNYLSAWTLMGHEYVEMKNIPAAVDAYHCVVDIVLMIIEHAMAQCCETEQLHMVEEAIKCYRRAANCNDREAIALHQLAKLYKELGCSDEAAFYYKKDLEREDGN